MSFPQDLEDLLKDLRREMQAQLDAKDRDYQELQEELREVEEKVETLEQAKAELQSQVDRLERENARLTSENEAIVSKDLVVAALTNEVQKLNGEILELDKAKNEAEAIAASAANQESTEKPLTLREIIDRVSPNTYKRHYLEILQALARSSGCLWYEVPRLYGSTLPSRLCGQLQMRNGSSAYVSSYTSLIPSTGSA